MEKTQVPISVGMEESLIPEAVIAKGRSYTEEISVQIEHDEQNKKALEVLVFRKGIKGDEYIKEHIKLIQCIGIELAKLPDVPTVRSEYFYVRKGDALAAVGLPNSKHYSKDSLNIIEETFDGISLDLHDAFFHIKTGRVGVYGDPEAIRLILHMRT